MKKLTILIASALISGGAFTAPDEAYGQTASERLTVHGYISQAFGQASDLGVAGINKTPTWDYRTAALQFRYGISDADNIVLQFGHRRLGESVLNGMAFSSDVFIDWGFYQRRFGSVTARAGKIPMPRGIYNETRDVGTLLPFYRAPLSFYAEGIETLDGVTAARDVSLGDAWNLELKAFLGSWEFVQANPDRSAGHGHEELHVTRTDGEGVLGGQLWLETPVQGLRVGFGGQRFSMDPESVEEFYGMRHGGAHMDDMDMGGMDMGGMDDEHAEEEEHASAEHGHISGSLWQASVDGRFERLQVRGEYQRFVVGTITYSGGYVQAGLKLTDRLSANVQGEFSRVRHVDTDIQMEMAMPDGSMPMDMNFEYTRDLAASLNFKLGPTVVLKAEGHTARGHSFDTFIDPMAPSGTSKYFLVSVAAAF